MKWEYLKYLLLAFLICILCVFLPEGMGNMESGMGSIRNGNVGISKEGLENLVRSRMEKMRSLGITEADGELEEQVVEEFAGYPPELMGAAGDMSWIDGMIFYYIGGGEYDFESWEWTPGSEQVYAFDVEVFEVTHMYTNFLRGIMPLMGDEVSITDIEEDLSRVDMEAGSGTQILRFRCNGVPYEFEAEVEYDWIDMNVAVFMNEALEKEKTGKRLWIAFDGGQGCAVFYNTEEWAKEFRKTMGYGLQPAQ